MMRRVGLWLLCLLIGLAYRDLYSGAWLWEKVPYAVEADCYTRLTRAKEIIQGHGPILNFHSFENAPIGIVPHTTLPLDACIVFLQKALSPWTTLPLDWAGAVVSPFLYGIAALLFCLWTRKRLGWKEEFFFFFGLAVLPGAVWATPFARPDHQSLTFLLVLGGLVMECERWRSDTHRWAPAIAGLLWGLALWTTLFEPLILLILVIMINLILRRTEQKPFVISLLVCVLVSLRVEGWRFSGIPESPHFATWLATIGELRAATPAFIIANGTPFILLLPFAAWKLGGKIRKSPEYGVVLILLLVTFILACWQRRWNYFEGGLILLTGTLWMVNETSLFWKRLAWLVWIIGGLTMSWYTGKPNPDVEPNIARQTRAMAPAIRSQGNILAPWWISPSLLYYTGNPIISSSSHQSLEGIVSTCKFFTATSWTDANAIVESTEARWVVIYDADRVLENSAQILGMKRLPKQITVAEKLWTMKLVPTRYKLRGMSENLKVYEVFPPENELNNP